FSPDGKRLASASWDRTVKVWHAGSGQETLTSQQLLEREARSLVRSLFAQPLLRSDVLAAIRVDVTISEPVREAALKLAETFPEKAGALIDASWAVVRQPGVDAATYQRALRQAEAACRLVPDEGECLLTLGVAYYRVGKYPEALQTLTRSERG